MRVHPLFSAVLCGVMAVSVGRTAVAQFTPGQPVNGGADDYGFGGMPPGEAYGPGEFGPPAPPAGPEAATFQPTMTGWPRISPFDNRFEEHQVDNGLWYRDIDNSPRRYYFNPEVWFGNYRRPERVLIGNEAAIRGLEPPPGQDIRFQPATTGALYGDYVGASLLIGSGFFRLNTNRILQERGEGDSEEGGVRLRGGFTDPDNTGFDLEAFWMPETDYFFQRGSREGGTNFFITAGFPILIGDPNFIGPVATNVQFNRFFRIEFEQQAAGGNMNWRFTNLIDTRSFSLQPTIGARYLFVRERFGFEGISNPSGDGLFIFNNQGYIRTFLVDPDIFPLLLGPDFTQLLESDVESHMAGPQVGLRYDLGRGEKFRIHGQTDFGLLVNYEQLQLRGFGIGDPARADYIPGQFFHKEADHVHASPMIASTIGADLQIFPYIPILRHWHLLDKARLSFGYSFLGVWEVSRPHRNIEWVGQPFTPVLVQDDRSHWYVHGGNLGLRWDW